MKMMCVQENIILEVRQHLESALELNLNLFEDNLGFWSIFGLSTRAFSLTLYKPHNWAHI